MSALDDLIEECKNDTKSFDSPGYVGRGTLDDAVEDLASLRQQLTEANEDNFRLAAELRDFVEPDHSVALILHQQRISEEK